MSASSSSRGLLSGEDPFQDGHSQVKLLRISGDELDVVNAARVSLGVHRTIFDPVRDGGLIRYLARNNHSTPFEHVTMSFRVRAPIVVARHWMRHRLASYNEVSGRYTEVEERFYVPKMWRQQSRFNRQVGDVPFQDADLKAQYEVAVEDAFKVYKQLLAGGVCREQARMVLPLCVYTEFYFSCNLLMLINFLRLRLGLDAQWEIRRFAEEIFEQTKAYFPTTYEAWGIKRADSTEAAA